MTIETMNAQLIEPQNIPLDEHFIQELDRLKNSFLFGSVLDFVAKYGTHYVKKISLGGRITEENEFLQFGNSKEMSGISNNYYTDEPVNKKDRETFLQFGALTEMFEPQNEGPYGREQNNKSTVEAYGGEINNGKFPDNNSSLNEWKHSVRKNPTTI